MSPTDEKNSTQELKDLLQRVRSASPFDSVEIAKKIAADALQNEAYQQLWQDIEQETDLTLLGDELENLKQTLKDEAQTPEQFYTLTEVARAEQEAKAGNGPTMLMSLQKAGNWAYKGATKIGSKYAIKSFDKIMKP